mgnify:CR=1 FL=1
MAFLANARNAWGYLLYLLFAVPLCDVAAFTFGRIFGRHKFRPNISPNKTWEGLVFVNLDPGAPPLDAYAAVIPFGRWEPPALIA